MIDLVCSADARFAPDCAVLLASLVDVNPPDALRVHLLHDDSLPADELESLCRVVTEAGGRCDSLALDRPTGAEWPASQRFPANAWYRVRIAELLPGLTRVLYVDADAMCTASLEPLWETDLAGNVLAAVTNPLYPSMVERVRRDLGVPDAAGYFNSGVLLIDLEAWRAGSVTDELAAFVERHPVEWPDQDALNGVLHARRLRLHPRWNAMPGIWELPQRHLPYSPTERREAAADPAIVHFVGPHKPWHYRSRHPYRDRWFSYLEGTPWRGRTIEGRSAWQSLLRPLPAPWAYTIEVGALRWRARIRAAATRVVEQLR